MRGKKILGSRRERTAPTVKTNVALYALSNIGLRRSNNEDVAGFYDSPYFSAAYVADGMGGSAEGEVASKLACDSLLDSFAQVHEGMNLAQAKKFVHKAMKKANGVIHRLSSTRQKYYGMGTTLVFALRLSDVTLIANCGDSRCYSYQAKEDRFTLLTVDQTVVEYLYRLNVISKDERDHSPRRHVLMNVLGYSPTVQYDLLVVPNKDYDELLLCSDGLTNMVEDTDISRIVAETREEGVKSTASALITAALLAGGIDNVSVALMEGKRK